MFTVAIIGPDGVGKTSVSRQLEKSLPMRARYLYMGVNVGSSNVALPTSRWAYRLRRWMGKTPDRAGPQDPDGIGDGATTAIRRAGLGLKRALRLINRLAEEWYRQLVVRWYLWRGYVVLLDRDFFADYYAYDIAGSCRSGTRLRSIHGFMLTRFYRRPDLMICLDAEAETMFARKGEGTVELLDRRRRDYFALRSVIQYFVVVDANRPLEDVAREVHEKICEFQNQHSARVRLTPCSR